MSVIDGLPDMLPGLKYQPLCLLHGRSILVICLYIPTDAGVLHMFIPIFPGERREIPNFGC